MSFILPFSIDTDSIGKMNFPWSSTGKQFHTEKQVSQLLGFILTAVC